MEKNILAKSYLYSKDYFYLNGHINGHNDVQYF